MALPKSNQNSHSQQTDEYQYDDTDEFLDESLNAYNPQNNHELDDSEGLYSRCIGDVLRTLKWQAWRNCMQPT